MKIYISGAITGLPEEEARKMFEDAADRIAMSGHTPINPMEIPYELEYEEHMYIDEALITICDGIYMLENWNDSLGARKEHRYAVAKGKRIIYEEVEE